MIHRDIKPDNVLFHDGRALVADFGIALAWSHREGETRLTRSGVSLGTPQYMSPEQASGEQNLDPRTDVYALGVVLYEMLAGQPPFTGPTARDDLQAGHVGGSARLSFPSASRSRPTSTPPSPVALEKLPADRWQTAAAVRRGVDRCGGRRAGREAAAGR